MSLQKLEELQKRLRDVEQLRKEEQQLLKEEQQRRKEAEQQLQNTTLAEFLDACHLHLFLGLTVQIPDYSTTGNPANAERKLRPDHIQEWKDFPGEQSEIWKTLISNSFVTKRHFSRLVSLKDQGEDLRQRSLSSELDLGYFERQTVETRVASVIKELHRNNQLRKAFCLKGDVAFENHANTLTDEELLVEDVTSMSLRQAPPRRSERIAAKSGGPVSLSTATRHVGQHKTSQPKHPRPKADQFCVYNKGTSERTPAFIIEYKAPHKLSLAHIKAGLLNKSIKLEEIIRVQENEGPEVTCRRVIAAVITQAFSYMVTGGVEYGYVCTGEAFIFLRVLQKDPSTVYYYLSIPKEDVGDSTGWTGSLGDDNRLHLTAVGQVLAFTLRALRTPTRDSGWITLAENRLTRWEMVYDDIIGKIEEKDISTSHFKPALESRFDYCRMSPVKTRSKTVPSAVSCRLPGETSTTDDDDDDDDEFDGYDPDTPSRKPQTRREDGSSSRRVDDKVSKDSYVGMSTRGTHRKYSKQLGCESLHIHGTRGALFEVTLLSHGYRFVGKGVPSEFLATSKHEQSIYARLAAIQGIHVPVVLGGLDVPCSLYYDGIVQIVHLMLMSYTGQSTAKLIAQWPERRNQIAQKAETCLRAVHKFGVLHSDVIPSNILWDSGNDQVMLIDFERAVVAKREMLPLVSISPNQKRKRVDELSKNGAKPLSCFDREARRLRNNLL
ncbi:hypothetical protein ED733_000492 [Metarhizium rileyi]|uniref:Aminoglycoside phosphotransferase domain-containing protein n=1 Tax=Metarhizium rileyi (strain RCEF 4871) TaxID=1649241 RepID=A0A5C6FYL4_METRR|nr:hypothetical protein ED733_000492 [Metarhizium rileyi]